MMTESTPGQPGVLREREGEEKFTLNGKKGKKNDAPFMYE